MPIAADERTRLLDDITVALGSLGDHPPEVARRILEAGIRAEPGDGSDCPIAMYLSPAIAGHDTVRSLHVTGMCVIIKFAGAWHFPLMVPLPGPVRSFIDRFDAGAYPDLIGAADHATASLEHAVSPAAGRDRL